MNIARRIATTAEKHPDHIAIIDGEETRTYAELLERARKAASLVRSRIQGDHVAICLPSGKEFVTAFLAVQIAGKIPVPINFLLQKPDVAFILEDAEVRGVITATFFQGLFEGLPVATIYLDKLGLKDLLFARSVEIADTPEDSLALLLYTSGTESRPKGVQLTHRNLIANVTASAERAGFERPLVFLGVLPLFHSFALTTTMLIPLFYGSSVVYHKRFQPRAVLESIPKHRIQVLLAVPSMFRLLIKAHQSDPVDLSSVIIAIAGGEPLPPAIMESFEKTFGFPLLEGYGLSETSPVVSLNTHTEHRPGTAGKVLPNLEARILDDEGHGLPAGREGELLVRGPSVMKGYWKRPEATASALTPDGWFRTGDRAILDADGYLAIKGRKKELIIISGENVSPTEIEEAIASHPSVFEVAVLAVTDPKHGELPKAFVALHEGKEATEKEILAWCRERIAGFKVPREVEFRKELPHGPTGKILKRALREEKQ